MKTIRRLIYLEVLKAVGFVTFGFLCLFFFFDFVDELQSVGKANALGYGLPQALLYVTLLVPSHLYELLPITVLIGTIIDELERRDLKRGLVTMCAAGGMAPAIIVERM